MKRVAAIFGGSFDPPHLGHVLATQYVLSLRSENSQLGKAVDAVWWVPCYRHAFDKSLTSFSRRMKMCELATATFAKRHVRVTDIEKRMNSDGRMLLVLQELAKRYKSWRFELVVGGDILAETKKWYKFDQIKREFGLIVVPRGGKEGIIGVSSSEVRRRIANKQSVDKLVPASVCRYVVRGKLYK